MTLKGDHKVTHSDNNSQSGSQYRDLVSSNGQAKKRRRILEEQSESESDGEDGEFEQNVTDTELYQLLEAGRAFIETKFKSKLDNSTRKAHATRYGVPDSRWLKCPKLDLVISTTVSMSACRADRSASRLQQVWLDATSPLVSVLERTEELTLPVEEIEAIQTSLQLMGNANQHNSFARKNALLIQLNPHLKQLVDDVDFKEVSLFLFGENFGTLAKEKIEAAAALTKTLEIDKNRQGFQKNHPQGNQSRGGGGGGGSQYSSRYNRHKGWQANTGKANNMKQQSSKKWQLTKDHVHDSTLLVNHSLNVVSHIHLQGFKHITYRVS